MMMKRLILATLIILLLCVSSFAQSSKIIFTRTAVTLDTGATVVYDINANFLKTTATRYVVECPNMTGNGTTTVSIVDANGVTVHTGSAHNENANYSVALAAQTTPYGWELDGSYIIRFTLSVAAGASGGTIYFTMYGH